jgi:hypothetical protein
MFTFYNDWTVGYSKGFAWHDDDDTAIIKAQLIFKKDQLKSVLTTVAVWLLNHSGNNGGKS